MTDLDALLAGIVADPREETRWLVLADWLEEFDDPRRAELLRLHRKLLATCCEPDAHPERETWHARVQTLLVAGVKPCVPRDTLLLPGGVPMTFAFVPPGEFLMSETSNGPPPFPRVEVPRGFFLGVYQVTQAQWNAVTGSVPSHFKGPDLPADTVSWEDSRAFCEALSGMTGRVIDLPSEAEWEYACRAGTTTAYHFGDVASTDLVNYDGNFTWHDSRRGKYRQQTTPVGSFPPNAWGLHDTHGNVWEWCSDAIPSDPEPLRVMRGGCWDGIPSYCTASIRYQTAPAHRTKLDGLRVCLRPS